MSARTHLFVCTSCRRKGEAKVPPPWRAGARLLDGLLRIGTAWAQRVGLVIAPVECLGACNRPCAVALRASGKYLYVFGDLQPGQDEAAVLECAELYRRAPGGLLPREQRPPALRTGILARVPPGEVG